LVSRLNAVEAPGEAMLDSMDFQSYARVEDIDYLHQKIDDLTDDIERLQDSVAYLPYGWRSVLLA